MRECEIYDLNGIAICRAKVAERFKERLVGLLRHKELEPGRGLLLRGCSQVHTFGMRFTIDVVFISKDLNILEIERSLKPGRVSRYVKGAYWALELGSGAAENLRTNDAIVLNML